jgi:uncharacterized protein
MAGDTFDAVMKRKHEQKLALIENAVGIQTEPLLALLCDMVARVKARHKHVLVHVHQYEGSTVLHELLEKATGVKTILDKTNFHESPVDYRTSFPDVDAVVSLSQCAGLGVRAGTWIVPTSFLAFDVHREIVYTTPMEQRCPNQIRAVLPPTLSYVEGAVLVVDDLWNPPAGLAESAREGVLLLDRDDERVLAFVRESTQIFDETHDWRHAVRVARHATQIRNSKQVLYLALLHDVCDHKYPKSIPRASLSAFVRSLAPAYWPIDSWIDRVSFSAQIREEKKTLETKCAADELELQAVRDADRIEALGPIGIARCIALVRERKGRVPEDVLQHCHDKLLRLYPERYIASEIGRAIALPLHEYVADWVKNNTSK